MEEVMEDFAELMQRLLEIQNGGHERSPKLVAEDNRLMQELQKKYLGEKAPTDGEA
jgi:ssRNA-specific RNase YbeY (16S rRNA maturation enzyme)